MLPYYFHPYYSNINRVQCNLRQIESCFNVYMYVIIHAYMLLTHNPIFCKTINK